MRTAQSEKREGETRKQVTDVTQEPDQVRWPL